MQKSKAMILESYSLKAPDRYSAKKVIRPTNFSVFAPDAKRVSVIGDWNGWRHGSDQVRSGSVY